MVLVLRERAGVAPRRASPPSRLCLAVRDGRTPDSAAALACDFDGAALKRRHETHDAHLPIAALVAEDAYACTSSRFSKTPRCHSVSPICTVHPGGPGQAVSKSMPCQKASS